MPRKNDLDSKLQDRINAFVEDVSAIVREAALEAVRDALSTEAGAAASVGRPKAAAGRRRAPAKKTASGRRVRRSAEQLEELARKFLSYVQSNPGQRLEEIGVGLRIDTAELKRPVQLLLEADKLRTEGERRGTRYFAGKGGPRTTTNRSAGRKPAKKSGGKKRAKKA